MRYDEEPNSGGILVPHRGDLIAAHHGLVQANNVREESQRLELQDGIASTGGLRKVMPKHGHTLSQQWRDEATGKCHEEEKGQNESCHSFQLPTERNGFDNLETRESRGAEVSLCS